MPSTPTSTEEYSSHPIAVVTPIYGNEEHDWQCAGTTKAGNRCRARVINRFTPTCHRHLTAEITRVAEAVERAYQAGQHDGRIAAENKARFEAEIADRQRRWQEDEARNFRTHTSDGRQVFTTHHGMAYVWSGPGELNVGDEVEVPASWAFPAQVVTVAKIGSAYTGTLVSTSTRAA